jgi:hypothetical protein
MRREWWSRCDKAEEQSSSGRIRTGDYPSLTLTELFEPRSNVRKGRTLPQGITNPAFLDKGLGECSEACGRNFGTFVLICGDVINM